jgi:hypothetical protein
MTEPETQRRANAIKRKSPMSRQSPNQRLIAAGLPIALKTEAISRKLQENFHEKQGYSRGYRTRMCAPLSSNFNSLDEYFDNRRGHQSDRFGTAREH